MVPIKDRGTPIASFFSPFFLLFSSLQVISSTSNGNFSAKQKLLKLWESARARAVPS